MIHWPFTIAAAALLSLERICYVWISRDPEGFRAVAARRADPVDAIRHLFLAFKALQGTVFLGWWHIHGQGTLALSHEPAALVLGATLITAGQTLSVAVFQKLGREGVFYGNRFGHPLPWRTDFPFSVLAHPQYVGTVLTIWGIFLILRFPHPDWAVLPALETVYYAIGARLEAGSDKA
jgi:methylene-fatty-acyl-phospholipid synthase